MTSNRHAAVRQDFLETNILRTERTPEGGRGKECVCEERAKDAREGAVCNRPIEEEQERWTSPLLS